MLKHLQKIYVVASLIVAFAILYISVRVTVKQQGGPVVQNMTTLEIENENKEPIESQHSEIKPTEDVISEIKSTTGDRGNQEIRAYIAEVFGEGEGCDWAISIAECESGLNPNAENPNGFYGLFQFHPTTYANCGGEDIWDWKEQVRITKECMYDKGRQGEYPACNRKYLSKT